MKIGLYLMNQKGFSALDALVDHFSEYIGFVVAAKDAAVINDFYADIRDICVNHKISFYDRTVVALPAVDYQLAIGWRWLISRTENLIVLHDSLLPKYRGFAPLVNSLINGEQEIGVTAIWAGPEFDAGEIIFQEKARICYPIKIQEAIEIVSGLYRKICIAIFNSIRANQPLVSFPQIEDDATYSLWRDEEDYRIDWSQSSKAIKRFIDAVAFPYQGAQSLLEGNQKVFIDEATIMEDIKLELRHPGKVIKLIGGNPVVVCGEGLLQISKMRCKDGTEFRLQKLRVRFK